MRAVDGNNNSTYYYYDAFNRLAKVKNALNEVTTYSYDTTYIPGKFNEGGSTPSD